MRQPVIILDAQRGLVVVNRFVDPPVFEEHIADVHDRGDESRVGLQGIGKSLDRRLAVTPAQMGDAAFVMDGGSLGGG